jgi:hypothetical protein
MAVAAAVAVTTAAALLATVLLKVLRPRQVRLRQLQARARLRAWLAASRRQAPKTG